MAGLQILPDCSLLGLLAFELLFKLGHCTVGLCPQAGLGLSGLLTQGLKLGIGLRAQGIHFGLMTCRLGGNVFVFDGLLIELVAQRVALLFGAGRTLHKGFVLRLKPTGELNQLANTGGQRF